MQFARASTRTVDPSAANSRARGTLLRGIVALAVAWLAWLYWFSRAALLTLAAVGVGVAILVAVRTARQFFRSGHGLFRQFGLRVLLTLARRMV